MEPTLAELEDSMARTRDSLVKTENLLDNLDLGENDDLNATARARDDSSRVEDVSALLDEYENQMEDTYDAEWGARPSDVYSAAADNVLVERPTGTASCVAEENADDGVDDWDDEEDPGYVAYGVEAEDLDWMMEQDCGVVAADGIFEVYANALKQAPTCDITYETLALPIVYQAGKTGFEASEDLEFERGELIASRYEMCEKIGEAAFSTALKCLDLKTKEYVCMKMIKNEKAFFDQSLDEIKLLRYLNNPADDTNDDIDDIPETKRVLRMFDFFYHREHLFIVTELLRENLYEVSRHVEEGLAENYFSYTNLASICLQCLTALQYTHSLGLIHCDVKPENVLIQSFSKCKVKLIDFGSSCFETDDLTTYVQSRAYRAPEVVLGLPYGPKIDMWSLGCVIAELHTGRVTFQNESVSTMLAKITSLCGGFPRWMLENGTEVDSYFTRNHTLYEAPLEDDLEDSTPRGYTLLFPKRSSLSARLASEDDEFVDFVCALCTVDPNKRLDATQALKHPFIIKYASQD